jgi:diguanylate cyclase (GGDEF)-like protein/PAS domain S-box-containing protein
MTSFSPKRPPCALIIEDDAIMRLLLAETLLQEGFTVLEAENGAVGIELFSTKKPDIVLLDVIMPEMDGFTACMKIRQKQDAERIPIVMMTGLDDVESINHAYDIGATDFITKPVNWTILGHRLRYLLRASQTLQNLANSQARLANAQRLAQLGHWDWDLNTHEMYWSDEIYRMLGMEAGKYAACCDTFLEAVHPEDKNRVRQAFAAALQGERQMNFDVRLGLRGGEERFIHAQAELYEDPARGIRQLSGTLQDVTERRRTQEQIHHLAYYDSLTGLPNRQLFKELLAEAMNQASTHANRLATLFLDLDKFQRINDTFGPSIGDRLLQQVAERVVHAVRGTGHAPWNARDLEPIPVARLGGDEFTVLIKEIEGIQDAAKIARRIINALNRPFLVSGHEFFVTASIGIAVYPDDGSNADHFMKNGDAAMYHAKERGRNNYQFYNRSMNASALNRLVMESKLRRAIEKQEFILYYQPQVDVENGNVVGVEALIRWQHPELGLTLPAEFVSIAEEAGLMTLIGEWVLRTACRQNRRWQEAGMPYFPVAVNISSPHFRQPDLAAKVAEILQEAELDPAYLELEVTESMLMEELEPTLSTLSELKKMGIRLSVDDFGTGYSSLCYLKRFPLNTLKIDWSFVRDITTDVDDAAITGAIIAMANSLRLDVIAEGVENKSQADLLTSMRCFLMQGFHFSEPLPAEAIPQFIRTQGVRLRSRKHTTF